MCLKQHFLEPSDWISPKLNLIILQGCVMYIMKLEDITFADAFRKTNTWVNPLFVCQRCHFHFILTLIKKRTNCLLIHNLDVQNQPSSPELLSFQSFCTILSDVWYYHTGKKKKKKKSEKSLLFDNLNIHVQLLTESKFSQILMVYSKSIV